MTNIISINEQISHLRAKLSILESQMQAEEVGSVTQVMLLDIRNDWQKELQELQEQLVFES